jgi:flagellar motor switch protein FliN
MSTGPIEQFVEALPAAASQALAEKSPGAWAIALEDKPKAFPAGTQLLTMLLVAEPSKAEAAIQISLESTLLLAGVLTGATPPTQFKPEHAQGVRAILAKACEKAAEALGGLQVQLQLAKALAWAPAKQFSLTGTDGAARKIQLQVLFTADWPKAAAAAPASPDAARPAAPAAAKGVNVSMLENVELDVSLRFGQRQLSLREIGELRSGSVIDLDKYVQDPAELLLGDRVVARGEVVIVDGNYGLRVTEVV